MANSGSVITRPVRQVSDVSAVLGTSENRLTYLCRNTHGLTNKWAKFKPIPGRGLFQPMSDEQRKLAMFGLSASGNYMVDGITVSTQTDWNTVEWIYDASKITNCALSDWENYDHAARIPLNVTVKSSPTFYKNSPVQAQFDITAARNTEIAISDFASLGDAFFAIVMYGQTSGVFFAITLPNNISWCYANKRITDISVDGARLNDIQVINETYDWWVCALTKCYSTLTKLYLSDLSDANGAWFLSLPCPQPSANHGITTYQYDVSQEPHLSIGVWGISFEDGWTPYSTLMPISGLGGSYRVGSSIAGEGGYSMAVGISVKAEVGTVTFNSLFGDLRVSNNYAGYSAGSSGSGLGVGVYISVNIQEVAAPVTNGSLTIKNNGSPQFSTTGYRYFVVYASDILCAPLTFADIPRGQSRNITFQAGIGSAYSQMTVNTYN